MTFSDTRVVDLLHRRFIPVWETVAPVSVAVFNLGDGRSVKGTMGGEIALYFCRPDGKAFDVLPALHSPHATYWAMKRAIEFYDKTGATDEAILAHHRARLDEMVKSGAGLLTPGIARSKKAIGVRRAATDKGTEALGEMTASKSMVRSPETVVVVEPGGLDFYKRQVHEAFLKSVPRTPDEWKHEMFEGILEMELKGGEFTYDVDTLAPINIIED